MTHHRKLSPVDRLLCQLDQALRTLTAPPVAARANPAAKLPEAVLTDVEKRQAAGLMRVNHSGEICAQALYQGQALTAKLPQVRAEMAQAATEEIDHLAWCEERLQELNNRTSLLNPLWYSLSFGLGAAAGALSDRLSLGFVAATEDQVCKHLQNHLQRLPEKDTQSRAIVSQMLEDEARHAEAAKQAGGLAFPTPIKRLMTGVSKAMTWTSYHI